MLSQTMFGAAQAHRSELVQKGEDTMIKQDRTPVADPSFGPAATSASSEETLRRA